MSNAQDEIAGKSSMAGDSILGMPVGMGQRDAVRIAMRRDRLLAGLTLTAGAGFILALPFALREGAEFFLPLTTALVIAIALPEFLWHPFGPVLKNIPILALLILLFSEESES